MTKKKVELEERLVYGITMGKKLVHSFFSVPYLQGGFLDSQTTLTESFEKCDVSKVSLSRLTYSKYGGLLARE